MKLMNTLLLGVTFGICLSSFETAKAETKVEWKDVDKYRDIQQSTGHKQVFRDRVLKQLEKYISESSEQFLKDIDLSVTVTDLDLAGSIEYTSRGNVRVLRRVAFPLIKFDYQLVDKSGNILESDSVVLKDMAYLDRIYPNTHNSPPLKYEKRLLKEWFKEKAKK